MTCAIIGDSIALGLAMLNPHCHADAVVGRSVAVVSKLQAPSADNVVISAGSNLPSSKSRVQLATLRAKIRGNVVWILPVNGVGRRAVVSVAVRYGDRTVSFKPSADGVHPASYSSLNKSLGSI